MQSRYKQKLPTSSLRNPILVSGLFVALLHFYTIWVATSPKILDSYDEDSIIDVNATFRSEDRQEDEEVTVSKHNKTSIHIQSIILNNDTKYVNVDHNVNDGSRIESLSQKDDSRSRNNKGAASLGLRPSCFDNDGATCAYDEVGKYLGSASIFSMIHKPSDAIPQHRRIPASMGSNTSFIIARRMEGPKDGSLTALVEYNPTLLPLTSDMDQKLLDYLTGRYHPDISDEEANKVKYLSIARSSNLHCCGGGFRKNGNPTKEQSYLSLSLLDEHLEPIPNASCAVNTYKALLPDCYAREELSPFHDYQIIAARSTEGNAKKDQLFMIASNVFSVILPLDIRRVPGPTNDAINWKTKISSNPVPMIPSTLSEKTESLPDLFYGYGLQVRFMTNIVPPNVTRCVRILKYNAMDWKKNYHVFEVTDSNGTTSTYMETRPHRFRSTRKINFYAKQFEKYGDWELVPNGTFENVIKDGKRDTRDVQVNMFKIGEPKEQFQSPHEFSAATRQGRGTACCIDISFDGNITLKVGISHFVTPNRNYLSRFYAFDLKPPRFLLVALSGAFCFERMNGITDHNSETQIFTSPDKHSFLKVSDTVYDCPSITFASGITEYQADKNFAVISYGVHDCYSRSIVVSKERIKELLNVHGSNDYKKYIW
jgi:hypothetical protein